MKKIEYLTVTGVFNENQKEFMLYMAGKKFSYIEHYNSLMEFLGSEGWELISVIDFIGTKVKSGGNNTSVGVISTTQIDYIFKRELKEIKELSIEANKIKEILYKSESQETFQFKAENKLEQNSNEIINSIKNINFTEYGFSIGKSMSNSFISIYKDINKKEKIGVFSKKEVEIIINKRIDICLLERKSSILIILSSFEKENNSNFWDLKGTENYEVVEKLNLNVIIDIIKNKL